MAEAFSPEEFLTITSPPETEQLARRVAARSGRTLEDVLKQGVEMEARIAGIVVVESTVPRKPVEIDRARDIVRRISSRPLLDPRTPRDILEQAWLFRMIVVDSSVFIATLEQEPEAGTHRRSGKGNDKARLNLGDCAAYALIKVLNVPLLYKGRGFFPDGYSAVRLTLHCCRHAPFVIARAKGSGDDVVTSHARIYNQNWSG